MSDFAGRDISFETLAEMCGMDIKQLTRDARGQLNGALAQIREATPDLEDLELALVIEGKAKAYRASMPDVLLTPPALAKHWASLDAMFARTRSYPQHDREPHECDACGGLRFVLVGYREPKPSTWQLLMSTAKQEMGRPHPAHRRLEDGHEVYSPCPTCSPAMLQVVTEHLARFDRMHGHVLYSPPAETLEALGRAVQAHRQKQPSALIPHDS